MICCPRVSVMRLLVLTILPPPLPAGKGWLSGPLQVSFNLILRTSDFLQHPPPARPPSCFKVYFTFKGLLSSRQQLFKIKLPRLCPPCPSKGHLAVPGESLGNDQQVTLCDLEHHHVPEAPAYKHSSAPDPAPASRAGSACRSVLSHQYF